MNFRKSVILVREVSERVPNGCGKKSVRVEDPL